MQGIITTEDNPLHKEVTAAEAAKHCGVTVQAITNWVRRGHLAPIRTDHRGHRIYRYLDVAKADHATRQRARKLAR